MINTLQIYKDSLNAGFTEDQAINAANRHENLYNQFKSEFASNKLVTIFGSLILAIGGYTLNMVIDIDKRVSVLEATSCVTAKVSSEKLAHKLN